MVARKKGFRVPKKLIKDIRKSANDFRSIFGLGMKKIDMVKVLEFILPLYFPEFEYVILSKSEMGSDEARTYPSKFLMHIREDIYDDLTSGDRRAQFTIAHEVGHLVLHQNTESYVSFYARSDSDYHVTENSEWQADTFAAELLMPYPEAINYGVYEIYEKFGVSFTAAEVRYNKLHRIS